MPFDQSPIDESRVSKRGETPPPGLAKEAGARQVLGARSSHLQRYPLSLVGATGLFLVVAVLLANQAWRTSHGAGAAAPMETSSPTGGQSPAPAADSEVTGAVENTRTDPVRFRADAWYLPDEPLLGFIEIPAGSFRMGSDKSRDPGADEIELPQHDVTLPAYFIGRYEVTVAQFSACVEDGGYQMVDQRTLEGEPNRPVTVVSCNEALAYGAWLTDKLHRWEDTPQPLARVLRGEGTQRRWQVTLPSEAEWEKAARGTDGRIYPWGDAADQRKASYDETGIGTTIAVGSFPTGASPDGVEDMSGNVWEWTRSLFREYPYEVGDGREDLSGRGPRVVRGGSFHDGEWVVRAANRSRYDPDSRHHDIRFRVVVSPILL